MATKYRASNSNTLGPDEWLYVNHKLISADGSAEFVVQPDGKVVIYKNGNAIWQTTAEQRWDTKGLVMQGDGNLVLYANNSSVIWASGTEGKKNVVCTINNDGTAALLAGEPVYTF